MDGDFKRGWSLSYLINASLLRHEEAVIYEDKVQYVHISMEL